MKHDDKIMDEGRCMSMSKGVFWLVHILGPLAIFLAGVRVGKRIGLAFPGIAFHFLRMMLARR
ncbi:MAG: hypothetical protein N2491_08775 [Negativicutes bacterium]|nr:hypothetical protein [Negativicutes bacterium]